MSTFRLPACRHKEYIAVDPEDAALHFDKLRLQLMFERIARYARDKQATVAFHCPEFQACGPCKEAFLIGTFQVQELVPAPSHEIRETSTS